MCNKFKFRLVEKFDSLTDQQKSYFRHSKVRDNSGNLLVCYHGTYQRFDDKFSVGDIGFHFGTLKAANDRKIYKKQNDENWNIKQCYLNIENPFIVDFDCGDWTGWNIAVTWLFGTSYDGYDEWKNGGELGETYIPQEFEKYRDEIIDIAKTYSYKNSDRQYNSEQNKRMRKLFRDVGYDGIQYYNTYEGDTDYSYIAFYPNQIKLIANENPTQSDNFNEQMDIHKLEIEKIKKINKRKSK